MFREKSISQQEDRLPGLEVLGKNRLRSSNSTRGNKYLNKSIVKETVKWVLIVSQIRVH